jgi:hypothetical protein
MRLNYIDFINIVEQWLTGTTVHYSGNTGITYSMSFVMKIDNKDRIAGFRDKKYPGAFITPLPVVQPEYGFSRYACRIYLADKLARDRSNYFDVINNLITFSQTFYEQIPHEYNKLIYPVTYTIPLLWDDQVEGLYFDFSIKSANNCFLK